MNKNGSRQHKAVPRKQRSPQATSLRRQATKSLAQLPPERLRVALDFLRYLEEYADQDLVEDLTQVAELRRAVARAEKQIATGRSHDWRRVRDDV